MNVCVCKCKKKKKKWGGKKRKKKKGRKNTIKKYRLMLQRIHMEVCMDAMHFFLLIFDNWALQVLDQDFVDYFHLLVCLNFHLH